MNARGLVSLSIVVLLTAAACGGLNEASTQACSEGKATATRVREFVDVGPPEVMIELARSASPKFEELAAKADDEDVKSSLTSLSKTFTDFKPDMSRRPTALKSDREFNRYVDGFKTAVRDGANNLDQACS
jgi:hypothetical protein